MCRLLVILYVFVCVCMYVCGLTQVKCFCNDDGCGRDKAAAWRQILPQWQFRAKKLIFNSVVRRWQHQITTLSCFCVSLDGRSLISLWCKASSLALLLLHWRRLTSPHLLAPDERTSSSVCLCVHVCVCMLTTSGWKGSRARFCGNVRRESQKTLYPEPLRLRTDGQQHTHRQGHQRLSVGWAANEVWRDWLV